MGKTSKIIFYYYSMRSKRVISRTPSKTFKQISALGFCLGWTFSVKNAPLLGYYPKTFATWPYVS
jgi:hypothetical protein